MMGFGIMLGWVVPRNSKGLGSFKLVRERIEYKGVMYDG